MNWGEILKMVIPILVVSIGWLLGQVSSFSNRLISLESKMPALITAEGVPTDSPLSAERDYSDYRLQPRPQYDH